MMEKLESHVADMAFWELWAQRCEVGSQSEGFRDGGVEFPRRHMETVRRFGRYPSRNGVLRRESTEEEVEFLKENSVGF